MGRGATTQKMRQRHGQEEKKERDKRLAAEKRLARMFNSHVAGEPPTPPQRHEESGQRIGTWNADGQHWTCSCTWRNRHEPDKDMCHKCHCQRPSESTKPKQSNKWIDCGRWECAFGHRHDWTLFRCHEGGGMRPPVDSQPPEPRRPFFGY